ncbi:MAG: histidinol-phosphate transaminase [Acidobacteria bacterium]|nr:histidinol-phosphate transaminase [Acidobacteriota bacterium]
MKMNTQLPVRQAILDRKTYEPPGEGRGNKLRLDFNENTAGCSPAVRRALGKLTPQLLSMYPEYDRGTRRLSRHFHVKPDQLLLTNGGDDALRLFFDAFVDAGTEVVIVEPTFPMYRYWGEVVGARINSIPYGKSFGFPTDAVLQSLASSPRVLFICNPNNPTGTLVEKSVIETILRAAPRTVVVIDEAYVEFSKVTVAPWIDKYPQLYIARTFSKAAGLASLRLGAVLAAADSLAVLRRATAPFPVNLAALVAAEAAVADRKTMQRYVKDILRLRPWFVKELHKLGFNAYPTAGNFVLVDFGDAGSGLIAFLAKQKIIVRDRRDIAPGHIRVSIGTQKQMERLLRLIKRFLRDR